MINISLGSKKYLLLTAFIAASLSYGVNYLITDATVKNLESSLAQKEAELQNVRLLALRKNEQSNLTTTNTVTEICKHVKAKESQNEPNGGGQAVADTIPHSVLILKDLETISDTDHRPYSEKLNELLAGNPTKEKIAIASRAIFDMAHDQQYLPDYALQSIYGSQTDPDLKRVIAQVLSQRGNNTLLYNQIAEAQANLKSEQPGDRQEALNQLAKMHSTKAVDAIAPFLQDPDTNVKLEALFALRDSGNQKHVNLVEMMVNDPDPSVSSLASEVVSNLRNLSSSARTNYSRSDIEAELPPIANP